MSESVTPQTIEVPPAAGRIVRRSKGLEIDCWGTDPELIVKMFCDLAELTQGMGGYCDNVEYKRAHAIARNRAEKQRGGVNGSGTR